MKNILFYIITPLFYFSSFAQDCSDIYLNPSTVVYDCLPIMEFNLEGEVGLITPLYLPINESSDLLIKPKFFLNQFFEKFSLNTLYERKNTGGNFKLEMDNISKKNDSKVNTSIRFNTKKIIDKNRIISASGLLSNNLSTTRSINEDSLAFEDIYLRIENYDFLNEKDYLKIDISGIESFETSSISSTIPILQNINYINNLLFNDKIISNDLDFIILQRDKSLDDSPSESFKISLKNEFIYNKSLKDINSLNKIVFVNNFNEHYFKHNKSLNRKDFNSNLIFSTSLFINKFKNLTPRLKFILPVEISQSNNSINENSNSLTFNYHNQYSENRLFGYDLFDNTPRFVYGIESNFNFKEQSIIFAINQSYDLNTKSNYLSKINQTSNFSDYSLMMSSEYGGINFEINARLDEKNLSKKEMDYSITSNKLVNLKINYHETESESFQNFSKNTKSIDVDVSKKINDNFKIGYLANLDVKNNYNPYETSLKVSLFDECSQLDLVYSNKRFNDNFETVPEDVFSITFQMDYLGLINVGEYNNIFKNEND